MATSELGRAGERGEKRSSATGEKKDVQPEKVRCVRLGELRTVEEHRDCPYCYGKDAEVAEGDRSRFCDYQPGKDPVHFGFPEGTTRGEQA